MKLYYLILFYTLFIFLQSCDKDSEPPIGNENFTLLDLQIDNVPVNSKHLNSSITPLIKLTFSHAVDRSTVEDQIQIRGASGDIELQYSFSNDDKTINILPTSALDYLTKYQLYIFSNLQSVLKEKYGSDVNVKIITTYDPSEKFPRLTETVLLDSVQKATFRYFWDFAHPTSGLARERNTSGDLVTIGGSGFGVMAIIVGIERGFISRQEGINRLEKIVKFLQSADRFHGVWPHWMSGSTGDVIPFSTKDNGGDLVETAFMIQGLLTVREYLDPANTQENDIINIITQLWEEVEWDWYTQGGQNVLYWHWSPNYGWEMNHQIRGWNEGLIVYVLAASSPTHAIDPAAYHDGWARNGGMQNGKEFIEITLPLGEDMGGPLFFAHYSFLGLDPRNLKDQYADYWSQNVSHTLINNAYCIVNPKNYAGYSERSWGLTASDNPWGYSAHSPTNDLGVITPTAALASIPYTQEESIKALEFFYYILGDKLWGPFGFYDSFYLSEAWFANSYLAIDQGPIIVMIENYRTALLWQLFMANPEIAAGLDKLGFTSY